MSVKDKIKKDLSEKSDEEIIASMKLVLRSKYAPPLSERAINSFLSLPDNEIKVDTKSMLAGFTKKVFASLHKRPVRQLAQPWPFGRWLEGTRQSVRLTHENVAAALGKDEAFVEQIETGEILPWKLSLSDAEEIVILFRVHMDVVEQLVHSSYVVSKAREALEKAESRRKKRFEEKDPSVKLAVDLYYARNSEPIEMNQEVTEWLISLRERLKGNKEGRILLKK